jgi:phage shock protein C
MFEKINKTLAYFEHQSFGVCSYWGDIWGISSGKIRIFFIYASFIAKGSPIIIYLSLGFLMNIKKYYRLRRNSIWDL